MVAHVLGGLLEQRAGIGLLHRRVRVAAAARTFEGVPAVALLALQVAGPAADAADPLEVVVIGFEFLIGDPPILDRQALGDEPIPVALADVADRKSTRLNSSH